MFSTSHVSTALPPGFTSVYFGSPVNFCTESVPENQEVEQENGKNEISLEKLFSYPSKKSNCIVSQGFQDSLWQSAVKGIDDSLAQP